MHSPNTKDKAIKLANEIGVIEAAKTLDISSKSLKRWITVGSLVISNPLICFRENKGGGRKTLDPLMEIKLNEW